MSITAWNPDRHCKTAGISRLGSYLLLQLCFWIQIHFQVLQVPAGITRLHAQVDSLVTMTMNFYCLTRNCFVFLQREATDSLLSFTAGTSPSVYEDTTRSYCTWRERERERSNTHSKRHTLSTSLRNYFVWHGEILPEVNTRDSCSVLHYSQVWGPLFWSYLFSTCKHKSVTANTRFCCQITKHTC